MRLSKYSAVTPVVLLGVCSAVIVGCGTRPNSAITTVPANAQKVNVVANNWSFKMDKTTLHTGKPIDFVVKSDQAVHGFSIVGTNIHQTLTEGEAPVNIVWTPASAGEYTIRCDQFCGSGHSNMFLTFEVGH